MKPGKRQLHLRFDAGDPYHLKAVSAVGDRPQEGGLPNPRFTADYQDAASPTLCVPEQ
jgi:hypothetical protein